MAKYEGSVCLNHPDVPASFRCAVCGKPICSECAIKDGGLAYCSQECRANSIRTGAKVDEVIAKREAGKAKRVIIRLIWLIVIAAAAVGGYFYYTNHKAEIDSKVKNATNQAEKAVKDAKKTVEDNTVNRQSQYKKDRENLVK